MSGRARAAAAALAAGLSLVGAMPARELTSARADQAAFLDERTARRAADAIAPGSDFVVWTCPSAPVRVDEAPVLYRAREVVLLLAEDHAEVRVTARRLAVATPVFAADVAPGDSSEPPFDQPERREDGGADGGAGAPPAPPASPPTPTASAAAPDAAPEHPACHWWVAGPSAAEPLLLDLAYVFVPDPAVSGRFVSLALRLGVEVETEARALTVPPPLLRAVAGPHAP